MHTNSNPTHALPLPITAEPIEGGSTGPFELDATRCDDAGSSHMNDKQESAPALRAVTADAMAAATGTDAAPEPREVVNVTADDETFKTRLLAALGHLDFHITSLRHSAGALMVGASDLSPVLDDIHRVLRATRELKAVRSFASNAANGTPKFDFYFALNKDAQRRLDSARAGARRAQTTMQRVTDAMARSASPEMIEAARYNNKIRDAVRLMGKMKFQTRQWQKLARVQRHVPTVADDSK